MFKRNKSILCLLIAILMMVSASTSAIAASPHETRYNNTVLASSVASISENGLLTINFLELEGKRPKAKSQPTLIKEYWGYFGHELILDNPIINGVMSYMITFIMVPILSN